LINKVEAILWDTWDPIGVNDEPNAFGEYDSYAPKILEMVQAGASKEDLYMHLLSIEEGMMGLRLKSDNAKNETIQRLMTEVKEA